MFSALFASTECHPLVLFQVTQTLPDKEGLQNLLQAHEEELAQYLLDTVTWVCWKLSFATGLEQVIGVKSCLIENGLNVLDLFSGL